MKLLKNWTSKISNYYKCRNKWKISKKIMLKSRSKPRNFCNKSKKNSRKKSFWSTGGWLTNFSSLIWTKTATSKPRPTCYKPSAKYYNLARMKKRCWGWPQNRSNRGVLARVWSVFLWMETMTDDYNIIL